MAYTVIRDGRRRCIKCCEERGVDDFYAYAYVTKSGKQSIRLDSRCKPCGRNRRKQQWRANHAVNVEKGRVYKKANRDAILAQMRSKRLSDLDGYREAKRAYEAVRRANLGGERCEAIALIRQVLEEARVGDRYLDAYTGELISAPEIDHIVPLSKGGKHEYYNLCVTSKANNSRKHAQPMLYWLATGEIAR